MRNTLDDKTEVAMNGTPQPAVTALSGSRHLAVTRSILSPQALLAVLEETYSVGSPISCEFLKFASNDTYLLTCADGRYVARVYGVRWRSLPEIEYELDLLRHVAARGVAVSLPVSRKDGGLTCPVAAPEGTRQLALFEFVPGAALSWQNEEHWELAGRWAAQFHAASDDFASRWTRPSLDLEHLIDLPLEAIRPFLTRRPDIRSYLESLAERLRTRLQAGIDAGLDWGVCHGDFEGKNIQLTEDHKLAVLDFDHCGAGWRMYDFASIYMNGKRDQSNNIWNAFLRGYTEIRKLAAADLSAVPLFPALQHLSALRMFAENAADWGSIHIGDGNLDYWVKYFRDWEEENV
jgi:Ser/Thr protein kinase RdoA (MazF antagonist)